MKTIAQIRAERMAGLREIRKAQRNLDSKVEIFERWILRALKWKEKVPDRSDILKMQSMIRDISRAFDKFINVTAGQASAWQI